MFAAPPSLQAFVTVNQITDGKYFSLRFLAPLALILCGFCLLMSGFRFSDLRDQLAHHDEWAPVLFIFCGVAAMTVFIPKTAVSLTAGAMFGTATGGSLMLLIAVAAAAINYCIARWWLHDTICTKLAREQQAASSNRLRTIRKLAVDAGFLFHLMVRLTPIPTTLISYTMGASGSRLIPFLAAAAVAVLPQLLWVQSGASAAMITSGSASPAHWMAVTTSVMAATLASVLVPKMALQRIRMLK